MACINQVANDKNYYPVHGIHFSGLIKQQYKFAKSVGNIHLFLHIFYNAFACIIIGRKEMFSEYFFFIKFKNIFPAGLQIFLHKAGDIFQEMFCMHFPPSGPRIPFLPRLFRVVHLKRFHLLPWL